MSLRIAYIGGNIGEGSPPFSTENAYADAFRELGHEVTPVKQQDARAAVGSVFAESDLVVYTRTHRPDALPPPFTDIWRLLEQNGTQTCSIHLDVFRGIPEREAWVEGGDPLFTTGTVFTADGSMPEWWKERGVNHVWLPPAADLRHLDSYDPSNQDTLPRRVDATGKIVFVGSEGYHPQYSWREKLIGWLRNRYRERFLLIGHGGPYGKLRMQPLADLYSQDAIFIGDHCFAAESRSAYWSDRLPESLGRGAFLIYPQTPGTWEAFPDCFFPYAPGNLDDLATAITLAEMLLPEARRETGTWGRAQVLAAHTYEHRAVTVLDTLGLA